MGHPERPLARQVLRWQAVVVLIIVVASAGLAAYDARGDARASAVDRSVAVAVSVADSPTVRDALDTADPSRRLQPYAERVRADTGVDFVVVMGLDRVRFTHRDPERIGESFVGDLGDAPEGGTFTQEYAGTLGPSMRAVVPVRDGGEVVALVSVGITIESIQGRVLRSLVWVGLAGLLALAVGLLGTWLVTRRLAHQTRGLGASELARMHEYHQAVLHAVREGLVLVDADGRVALVNDEARRLLDLPEGIEGRPPDALGLPAGLVGDARETTMTDRLLVSGDKVLVVSSSPARWRDRVVGAVITLRDRTELQAVTGELDVVRGLAEALQAQNHESANRLHTVVSLIEMGRPEEAASLATRDLAVAQELVDHVVAAVEDPIVAALLLGKSAEAAERGITFDIEGEVADEPAAVDARDLLTVLGNLIDNAFDAASAAPQPRVGVYVDWGSERCEITVDDSGPGIPEGDVARVLERGWSSKSGEDRGLGLALVSQVAARHRGGLHIDRSTLGGAEVVVRLEEPA